MNRVSIGLDNGLSLIRRQAIIRTNAGLLSIGPLGTNFSEILINGGMAAILSKGGGIEWKIQSFSMKGKSPVFMELSLHNAECESVLYNVKLKTKL